MKNDPNLESAILNFELSVPFPRSYWVEPGKLLAGYYPGDLNPSKMEKKLKGLLQTGIRYVINLMEENEHNWDGKHFRSYEDDIKRYAGQARIEITLSAGLSRISLPRPMSICETFLMRLTTQFRRTSPSMFTAGVERDAQELLWAVTLPVMDTPRVSTF